MLDKQREERWFYPLIYLDKASYKESERSGSVCKWSTKIDFMFISVYWCNYSCH